MITRTMINSFLIGMGSVFDFSGVYFLSNQSIPKKKNVSDADAIRSDWEVVGKDVSKAIESFKASNE